VLVCFDIDTVNSRANLNVLDRNKPPFTIIKIQPRSQPHIFFYRLKNIPDLPMSSVEQIKGSLWLFDLTGENPGKMVAPFNVKI